MSLDLNRVVSATIRQAIDDEHGLAWDPTATVTVADVITSASGIGYGGHFDEPSDDEAGIYQLVAGDDENFDDAEYAEILVARQQYANAVRDAVNALTWP